MIRWKDISAVRKGLIAAGCLVVFTSVAVCVFFSVSGGSMRVGLFTSPKRFAIVHAKQESYRGGTFISPVRILRIGSTKLPESARERRERYNEIIDKYEDLVEDVDSKVLRSAVPTVVCPDCKNRAARSAKHEKIQRHKRYPLSEDVHDWETFVHPKSPTRRRRPRLKWGMGSLTIRTNWSGIRVPINLPDSFEFHCNVVGRRTYIGITHSWIGWETSPDYVGVHLNYRLNRNNGSLKTSKAMLKHKGDWTRRVEELPVVRANIAHRKGNNVTISSDQNRVSVAVNGETVIDSRRCKVQGGYIDLWCGHGCRLAVYRNLYYMDKSVEVTPQELRVWTNRNNLEWEYRFEEVKKDLKEQTWKCPSCGTIQRIPPEVLQEYEKWKKRGRLIELCDGLGYGDALDNALEQGLPEPEQLRATYIENNPWVQPAATYKASVYPCYVLVSTPAGEHRSYLLVSSSKLCKALRRISGEVVQLRYEVGDPDPSSTIRDKDAFGVALSLD